MKYFLLYILTCFAWGTFAQATIYRTSADYGTDNAGTYEKVMHENKNLVLSKRDGSVTVIDLSKEDVWGFRNSWGEDYRLKGPKEPQRIVEFGEICVYLRKSGTTTTTANPDIAPGYEDNPYRMNSLHSFSIGPDGKIIKFSRSKFMKALRTDPATYEKFRKLVDNQYSELLLKIMEHNAELN